MQKDFLRDRREQQSSGQKISTNPGERGPCEPVGHGFETDDHRCTKKGGRAENLTRDEIRFNKNFRAGSCLSEEGEFKAQVTPIVRIRFKAEQKGTSSWYEVLRRNKRDPKKKAFVRCGKTPRDSRQY